MNASYFAKQYEERLKVILQKAGCIYTVKMSVPALEKCRYVLAVQILIGDENIHTAVKLCSQLLNTGFGKDDNQFHAVPFKLL